MSPTFLWVSNFGVKLGVGNTIFEITIFTWLFKYLGPNLSFFFLFFFAFFRFDEKCKNLFYHSKLKKLLVPSLSPFFFIFYWVHHFFRPNECKQRGSNSLYWFFAHTYNVPLGSSSGFTTSLMGSGSDGVSKVSFNFLHTL